MACSISAFRACWRSLSSRSMGLRPLRCSLSITVRVSSLRSSCDRLRPLDFNSPNDSSHQLQRLSCRVNRFVDIALRVRNAEEGGLELRRWQPDTSVEQGAVEAAELLG